MVCVDDACVESMCGDGFVDTEIGEQCEDGNQIAFDGCNPDCTFTCEDNEFCSDGDPCNGDEICSAEHLCENGTALDEHTECTTAAVAAGTCRSGMCVTPGCGNGFVDEGTEECDDGNTVERDGCDLDCTFSCDAMEPCENGDVCDGVSICQLASHTCQAG